MKKIAVVLALMLTSSFAFAQDASTETEKNATTGEQKNVPTPPVSNFAVAVDVVAPYLWRGLKYSSNKVAFQPYASYAITEKLTVGVWATTNFSNAADAYNEFDWSVAYQVTPIMKVLLSDYYWPATKNNTSWERSSYFDYSEGSAQTLDLQLLFDFSDKGVPLDFQWSTFIGGNDYKYDGDGNATRAFSSYAEAGYTYSWEKPGLDFRPFVGAVIINGGYYGTDEEGNAGFAFTNVGLNVAKEIKFFEKFSVPVFVRYTYNEYGYLNNDDELIHNFISGGITLTIK